MIPSVELILAPYDSAVRETRMGSGPGALVSAGLRDELTSRGIDPRISSVELQEPFLAEGPATFELHRLVKERVEAAVAGGRLSITLSGNCNAGVIGSLMAVASDSVGLIWFDAHSDAETPETTTSAFIDGMGLAMALRCCWRAMLDSVGDLRLHGARTALVGAREISKPARALLISQSVSIVPPERANVGYLAQTLDHLRAAGAVSLHVHVDLDVLDAERVGPANSYALPNGLTGEQLLELLGAIVDRFPLASASIASYDPAIDTSGAVAAVGRDVVALLASRGRVPCAEAQHADQF